MRLASSSLLHHLLLRLYYPFLLLVGLVMAGLIAYLTTFLGQRGLLRPVLIMGILLLGLTVLQVLWAACFVWSLPVFSNEMELRLPRKQNPVLYEYVEQIAEERQLLGPDAIRLAPDTIAHVYEEQDGKKILVLGGLAIAALTQEALAGVIAHELAHFAGGDTRLSRRGFRRLLIIAVLESRFHGQAAAYLNPLLWLVRLYHFSYRLAWAAHSRAQEYAADRHTVAQVGKYAAGAALIYLTVPERLPWVRLSSIAETCAATDQPMDKIFAEQHRLAKAVTPVEWEEALRKELKERTTLFDSHPCLKERLAALGVSPRKALQAALDQAGPQALALLPQWEKLEKELTCRLMIAYREQHFAKMELWQMIRD